jgi:hypothetical protein
LFDGWPLAPLALRLGKIPEMLKSKENKIYVLARRALPVRYFTGSWFLHQVMHNRKKLDRAPTVEEIAAVQKKTRTYASLVSNVLERRRTQDNSAETLALIEKMSSSSPDFYTFYNFRREILYDTHPQLAVCGEGNKYSAEDANTIREVEMLLSVKGIEPN